MTCGPACLPAVRWRCVQRSAAIDRVFFVGCQVGYVYLYSAGPAVAPEVEVLHLSADPAQVGRTYATHLGLVGDVKASIEALVPLVAATVEHDRATRARTKRADANRAHREKIDATAASRYDAVPMHPMAAVHALLHALPRGGVVVDESITTAGYLRGLHRAAEPDTYFYCRGGGLGWGMPAALGVKLARPEHSVLCVVGDGSAMYAVQALYTAARHRLGVVFAVVNNRQYRILRDNLATSGGRSAETGNFVAMDLDDPPIDYISLAAGMGVQGTVVEKATDITEATRAAFESGVPWLLELPVQGASGPQKTP